MNRTRKARKCLSWLIAVFCLISIGFARQIETRPNIILVMADDQGWGQVGYRNHPILKTPNLDAMAAGGLRLDRFYAGAPNCSPTRATILTGRSNDRTGVENHGYALRRQERTVAQALREAGYMTAHFGKWHLNGYSGPGAPVLGKDTHHPGIFGFGEWLSVTNFFDMNPIMSRSGRFEEFEGDSSEIIVAEALKFLDRHKSDARPMFTVIWFGTPHSPWAASDEDRAPFARLSVNEQNHYGELAAMDRSIGALRQGLRRMGIADNTLVWYCSDNGGLQPFGPATVGGLRGWKNTLYEGGLRVPGIIEWPKGIKPRVTEFPSSTMDIFPTLAELAGVAKTAMLEPQDGMSLTPLFKGGIDRREKPIPFRHQARAALLDNNFKLLKPDIGTDTYELYDLSRDPVESNNIYAAQPGVAKRMTAVLEAWNRSVEASVEGRDYPEGRVNVGEPQRRNWMQSPEYAPFLKEWRNRPEYR